MDLDFEKEKARYQHKLEIIRLVIDRFLIGIIVVGLGFAFNLALEDYKKEKHEFWMDYAEEVKRSWTSFLQNALVEKGIPAEDIELIKYDYNQNRSILT